MLKKFLKIILYKVQNCLNSKNCSNTKIVQIRKLFKFENCSISKNCSYSKNVQTWNLFKVQNCSISKNCSNTKIVQFLKLFNFEKLYILENCSNSKLFKLKNYSNFEFMQIQNCLKKKNRKNHPNSEPGKENRRKNTESIEPYANGPRPISLRLRVEPAKTRPQAEHRICRPKWMTCAQWGFLFH
jgi:hypothetical protein